MGSIALISMHLRIVGQAYFVMQFAVGARRMVHAAVQREAGKAQRHERCTTGLPSVLADFNLRCPATVNGRMH
jgi:hypothetical protein